MKLAINDLYGDNSETVIETLEEGSSSDFFDSISNMNFSFSEIDSINIENTISHINYFILAWMILHTMLGVLDFYLKYFIIAAKDNLVPNQKIGKQELKNTIILWSSYLPCLAIAWLYTITDGVWQTVYGAATILAFTIKFFAIDLPKSVIIKIIKGQDTTVIGSMLSAPFRIIKGFSKKGNSKVASGAVSIAKDIGSELGGIFKSGGEKEDKK